METIKPPFDAARHRRGGRPKKPDEERLDRRIPVRMSPQQKDLALSMAAKAGMSVAEFSRQAIGGKVEFVTIQEPHPATLRELRLLNRQINELLHEARRNPDLMPPELEDAAIDAMNTVSAELRIILHDPKP